MNVGIFIGAVGHSSSAICTGTFGFRHDWPEIVDKDDQGDLPQTSQENAVVSFAAGILIDSRGLPDQRDGREWVPSPLFDRCRG